MGEDLSRGKPDNETLAEFQDRRLRDAVSLLYENTGYYRLKMEDAGLTPDDVRGIQDVERLPLTSKEDFYRSFPTGHFATERDSIARVHSSTGTSGKPKMVGYTDGDVAVWREVMKKSLQATGLGPGDRIQVGHHYGMVTGGHGVDYGAEELGASVVPSGGGRPRRQVELISALEPDAIVCTPSDAIHIAEKADEMGVSLESSSISTVIHGAESTSTSLRKRIQTRYGAETHDLYGLSEVIGPGVAIEPAGDDDTLRIWESHFYPEIVDPETGEPLDFGQEGELVVTTLTQQGTPVVRYRTGDITTLYPPDGDGSFRMDHVKGRADDKVVINGTNVYPNVLEDTLLSVKSTGSNFRAEVTEDRGLNRMTITVEAAAGSSVSAPEVEADVRDRLKSQLALVPDEVDVVENGTLPRDDGKTERIVDRRD